MRQFDLTPFYRSTVGFDRLFATPRFARWRPDNGQTYPPYNIEKTGENAYRVTLAVAGFAEEDLSHRSQGKHPHHQGREERDRAQEPARSFIAASPRAPSSAASSSPTMSR